MIKYKNIMLGNVRFEVKIMDRYQRIVYQGDVNGDVIWDGIDSNTTGDAKKGSKWSSTPLVIKEMDTIG